MLQALKTVLSTHYSTRLKKIPQDLSQLMESPKAGGRGHVALPVFAWAKELKKAPPLLATELAAELSQDLAPGLQSIEAVSGFVNFTFAGNYIQDLLVREILHQPEKVGHSQVGNGRKLVIDFCSPNVAKPMHVGHLRAAVIGQAIVRLAKTQGFEVVGLNHLGDWGVQFGKLAWAFLEWGKDYPFAEKPFDSLYKLYVRFHDEAEKNPALHDVGSKMFKRLEDGDAEVEALWKQFVDISLKDYQRIWDQLGIHHDLVRGESFYNDRLKVVEKMLQEKGLLEESGGAQVVRLDEAGMPPCLIRKSDGASLYATRDLASAIYRMEELNAHVNLYVVGVDQTLHFRQVFEVLRKMGYAWVDHCHHIAFGMYRFKDTQISTRKGNTVFLEDVLKQATERVQAIIAQKNPALADAGRIAKQVGIGAIVFNDLMNDRIKNVDFDWARALDFEGDSGPYVQYCGVRCLSLMRKFGRTISAQMTTVLSSEEEVALLRCLLLYQDTLKNSYAHFKPHYLAGYLLEVCRRFNQFYNKCRILGEARELEEARMTLVQMVHTVIGSGLYNLSIELPDAM